MKNSPLSIFFRLAVSLGALAVILYSMRDKLNESIHILMHGVSWFWFGVALLTYLLANAVIAMRLRLVLRAQGIVLGLFEAVYLSFLGLFFNLFLPSAVGGDVAKAYYAYKHCGNKIAATTSVILDRLMGFVALISMALLALMIFGPDTEDPRVVITVYVFMGIMLLLVTFLFSKRFAGSFAFLKNLIPSEKWRERIVEIYHVIYGYKKHPKTLAWTLGLSLLGQSCFILCYYWITLALKVEMNVWIFFLIVPIISIVSMAPSLGGLGVREAGAIYLFSRFMPGEHALTVSLLADFIIYGTSFFSGAVYAMKGGLKARLIHEIEEIQ